MKKLFDLNQQTLNREIRRLLLLRAKYISDRQFIYILATIVGFISGLSAVIIKRLVQFVSNVLESGISGFENYLFFVFPVIGILITSFLVRFVIKHRDYGIPGALYAISKGNGNMQKKGMYTSVITSAITVGAGGSAGLEGPTVATTSAISSNLGKLLKLNRKKKVILISCAAAGALASIFKAPVAAIVFAIEVIMIDLTAASLVPLLLSSLAATLTSRYFLGEEVLFHFKLQDPLLMEDVPFYALLGLACGIFSVYFTRIYLYIADRLQVLKNQWGRIILGAALTGLLIFLFPSLFGEGYSVINALINANEQQALEAFWLFPVENNMTLAILAIALLAILKPIATSLTINGGGVGGVFAPTLFIGSALGYFFSKFFNDFKLAELSKTNFSLVAMGGMMAGVLHAPLTGIFLIAEITGGYDLFTPLMITSSIAFITVKYGTQHSIYTKQLAQRGELITHHKDQAILTLMSLKEEIETNFHPIHPYQKLDDLIQIISKSNRNLFPVLDEEGVFLGIVTLNDVRPVMFDRSKYETLYVHELMTAAPEFIQQSDSMDAVMDKFDQTGAWNLPVLNQEKKYIGFVSKSKLFSAYRELLKDFYDEDE